jgi:hypothetical protein
MSSTFRLNRKKIIVHNASVRYTLQPKPDLKSIIEPGAEVKFISSFNFVAAAMEAASFCEAQHSKRYSAQREVAAQLLIINS